MSSIASTTLADRSRLVALLCQLSNTKTSKADYNLGEYLGRLISVSDAISLSRSLNQLKSQTSVQTANQCEVDTSALEIREDVFNSRERMIQTIIRSFSHTPHGMGIQAPSVTTGTRVEALQTYEPYLRFYSMHQAQMAGAIQSLRLRVRSNISPLSRQMQQLAQLDKVMDDNLASNTSKLFDVAPRLLQQRFSQLLDTHLESQDSSKDPEPHTWILPGGWLANFYRDMQAVLLAELDLRLQPVIGLLEALKEETLNQTI